MKKSKLLSFISKYNLGGTVESAIWSVKEDEFFVHFISDDRELVAKITMKNLTDTILVNGKEMNGEVANLGVYNTKQLIRLLNPVINDLSLSLLKVDRGKHGSAYGSIKIKDTLTKSEFDFMLTETSIIQPAPAVNELPEFDLELNLDKNFCDTFIKSKNALQDDETFTIITSNNEVKVVIGHQTVNTDRATMRPKVQGEIKTIDNVSFSSTFLKEILSANSEAETSILKVSEHGLAMIEFETDDFDAKYYLIARQE